MRDAVEVLVRKAQPPPEVRGGDPPDPWGEMGRKRTVQGLQGQIEATNSTSNPNEFN